MTRKEFRDFVERKCKDILALLDKKGDEYSNGQDAFYNFNDGYQLATSNSPEEFAWDLRCKHLQSIKDMIMKKNTFTEAQANEKFGDDILYGFIIWGIMQKEVKSSQIKMDFAGSSNKEWKGIPKGNPLNLVYGPSENNPPKLKGEELINGRSNS